MGRKRLGTTLNSRDLGKKIQPYRQIDNTTNFWYIGQEYLTLAAILIPTIGLMHYHASFGFHWAWCIPIWFVGMLLVGAVQHRLAGLGHEGSHYILFKNRKLNEMMSDIFCMFPLFATTEQYRVVHLGHHQYVNDWDRDPELINLGKTRMMDKFPMTREQFVYNFFIRLMWPPALLRYLWDNIYFTALGQAVHNTNERGNAKNKARSGLRLTTVLGVVYIFAMIAAMRYFWLNGSAMHLITVPLMGWALASLGVYCIPEARYFQSPYKHVLSSRFVSVVRLGYYTALIGGLAAARFFTGFDWAIYFWALWVIPLGTSFPCYMLIRDIFQHANADDGRLTNSRVFFCDPFTRWAFFVYGQDVHLTHHLFAGIPHYHLPGLHKMLMEENEEYAQYVVECHGMFSNHEAKPTMVDVMTNPTREPEEEKEPAIASGSNDAAAS